MKRKHDEVSNSERERLLERIRAGNKYCFRLASDELKGDYEVALAAVSLWGSNLQFVSPELRDDQKLILAAVRDKRARGDAMQYAPQELRDDEDFVMAAVQQHGCALEYASPRLQGEKAIVMAAVQQNGFALRSAPPQLQDDYDVVMAAVSEHGRALQWASPELQGNYSIALAAVSVNGEALSYVSAELCGERDIVLVAVGQEAWAITHASADLWADEDVVITAVRGHSQTFKVAARSLRKDATFIAKVISAGDDYGSCLYSAAGCVKRDLRATASMFDTFLQSRNFLQHSLQAHAAFMEFLLCVTSESAEKAGNPVTKVNLDRPTFVELHRHIAEYAGIPLGPQLEPVRLVKRVMPILESYSEKTNENDFNIGVLQRICEPFTTGSVSDNED